LDGDGKCSSLVANDVTKEECCNSMGIAYNDAISNEAIFWLSAGLKGENCKPCKGKIKLFANCGNEKIMNEITESCDNIKCGDGKRCIMKRGQPKCVCAPNCKVTTTINTKNCKQGVNEGFTAFQSPEIKNINRHYTVVRPPPVISEMQNDEPTIIDGRQQQPAKVLNNKKFNHSLGESPSSATSASSKLLNLTESLRQVEWKFRNGYFNANSIYLTSLANELHLGYIVSVLIKIFILHPGRICCGRLISNSLI
jgi:hypothetical protein